MSANTPSDPVDPTSLESPAGAGTPKPSSIETTSVPSTPPHKDLDLPVPVASKPLTPSPSSGHAELRLAKWAIGAGLVAALIAGGSGVAGSFVGASMQEDAVRSQADREFTRTQQLEVYMDFLAAWDVYHRARGEGFTAVLALVDDRTEANAKAYSEALDAEYQPGVEVSLLITKMSLVGSTKAHQAATTMWDAMDQALRDRGVAQDQDEVFAISRTYHEAVDAARQDFYDAAQQDVAGSLPSN